MATDLRRIFPIPQGPPEETITILDTFDREWEVTLAEYGRFTVPPRKKDDSTEARS